MKKSILELWKVEYLSLTLHPQINHARSYDYWLLCSAYLFGTYQYTKVTN